MRVPLMIFPLGMLRARIRLIMSVASSEDLHQRTVSTNPVIVVKTIKTTMTTNVLMDGGGLSNKDVRKLAPTDKKKIAKFRNVEDVPPLSSTRNSSSDTK
jgi:hypothetical protein